MSTLNLGFNDADLVISAEDSEMIGRKSDSTTLTLNKKVKVPGSINGITIPTWATLRNADWHRITVRNHHIRRAGEAPRISQVAGISFRNVAIDVEMEIDGKIVSLYDFLYSNAKQLMQPAANQSAEEYDAHLRKTLYDCGIRFDGGMSLFLQQMGASVNGYAHAVENLKTAGAYDDIKSVAALSDFHVAYDFGKTNPGVKVLSFEMGTANRSQSATGQGFIDLVDSVVENFKRVWRHNVNVINLEKKKKATDSQEEIKNLEKEISVEKNMATSYFTSMSGATRQVDRVTKAPMNKYNPQNVPCGRWSALINGEVVEFDTWADSDKQPSVMPTTAPAVTVDTTQKPF
jgi:hypothetical protein